MKRRDFIMDTALAAAGLAAGAGKLSGAQDVPNVLLFIVDQMRQPRWFPEDARLPNLDRLKCRGIEFTRHFASAVPCSPSRACLFTGLYMDQHGVMQNMNTNTKKHPARSLDPGIPTLGRLFREAGYRTPYFGKWHLTVEREIVEKARSIDASVLEEYGFEQWAPPDRIGDAPYEGLIHDDDFTDRACAWLSDPSNHTRPWFLTVSLINPHDIVSYPRVRVPSMFVPDVAHRLPDNWDDDLEGKPRCQSDYRKIYNTGMGGMRKSDRKKWLHMLDYYYYLNLKIDAFLGKVMDALDKTGRAQNTIFIFTSDHGEMCGSHMLRSKGPFPYDENINVPLVVSWPGKIAGGAGTRALSQNVDILPTLAEMAGLDGSCPFDNLPGKSLAPVLSDSGKREVNDHVLCSFSRDIMLEVMPMLKRPYGPFHMRAIREPDWVFARYFDPEKEGQEFELYDLKNDPLQMKNLAGDPGYKAVEREMRDKLREAEAREAAPVKS